MANMTPRATSESTPCISSAITRRSAVVLAGMGPNTALSSWAIAPIAAAITPRPNPQRRLTSRMVPWPVSSDHRRLAVGVYDHRIADNGRLVGALSYRLGRPWAADALRARRLFAAIQHHQALAQTVQIVQEASHRARRGAFRVRIVEAA